MAHRQGCRGRATAAIAVLAAASSSPLMAQCLSSATVPPAALVPRYFHAMAYDAGRDRVVLFGGDGGWNGGGLLHDTWEFDGSVWLPGPDAPPALYARACHAMAYDALRHRVVLTGGSPAVAGTNETWELGATSWAQGAPAPPGLYPRYAHGLAFDAGRGRLVLFGGHDGAGRRGDVWEHDGSGWRPGVAAPSPRSSVAMAYDRGRDAVVAIGGSTNVPWIYDGASWVTGADLPPRVPGLGSCQAPLASAAAYDEARGRLVVVGSHGDRGTYYGGTWTWEDDGTGWIPGHPVGSGILEGHAMAYDSLRQRILLFGGLEGFRYSSLTNELASFHGPAPVLQSASFPDGALGVPYAQAIVVTGGTPPYKFRLDEGALPEGLSFDASGISGTPYVPGERQFVLQVWDAAGCVATRRSEITIAAGSPPHDLVVGQGAGQPNPNRVRVLRADGTPTPVDFVAYAAGTYGVNVTTGNNGGTYDDLFTGPGPGPVHGPHVRGFLSDGSPIANVSFYAYGTLKYGVEPATAWLDVDVHSELLTAPGPGSVFGPHVRGWNADGALPLPMPGLSFFAFATTQYGCHVAAGDVDGDLLIDEILAGKGAGPSFTGTVGGWRYDAAAGVLQALPAFPFEAQGCGFGTAGAEVAAAHHDSGPAASIVVAPGPGASVWSIAAYDYSGTTTYRISQEVLSSSLPSGTRLGSGDIDGDGRDEVLAGPGPHPDAPSLVALVELRKYGATPQLRAQHVAFPGSRYGTNVAAGRLIP